MKKTLLTTTIILGIVLSAHALSMVETVIISKSTESLPIVLISDSPCKNLLGKHNISISINQSEGMERLAIKSLKLLSNILAKGLCFVAKPEKPVFKISGSNSDRHVHALMVARNNMARPLR
jgi:hypothetical protein